MQAPIVDDELWALIESLLPPTKPRRSKNPGRFPIPDRAALNGILFVLKTGIRWNHLPTQLGFGSGRPVGADFETGTKSACGIASTNYCSPNCGRPTRSISHVRPSTHHRYGLLGRAKNWPEPHGSRATWLQAPHRHRRQRHTSGRDPDWRERQRCDAVAAADRRDSADSRPARPPDSTASSGLRRSRLRLRAASPNPAQSRHPADDRETPRRTR